MCLLGSPFQINHDEIEVTYCPKYRNQSMLLPHANGRHELFSLLLRPISDYSFIIRLLGWFGTFFGTVGTTVGLLCCIAFLLSPLVALFL